MPTRLWLAFACAAGAILIWWLAASEDGAPRPVAHAAAESPEAPRQPELAAAPRGEIAEPATLAPEAAEAPVPGPDARQALEASPAPVFVRVQLALASGAPGSFDGWNVESQSWLERTNETFRHETRANAAGAAEFTFPGFVHIDWLRCVPPPESGLALAFAEHHVDLAPGKSLEETLELEPGGVLAARVLDTDGQPVADARVHAYSEGSAYDLTFWQPGLVHATTGADGRFELPSLPPGEWCLSVQPDRWLQLEPEAGYGDSCVQIEAGSRVEGPDLCVAPLHRFRLRLVDALGRPVEEASMQLAPLEFFVERLAIRTPEAVEVFLGHESPTEGGKPRRIWAHGELAWTTDERGEATLFAVAGRWQLSIESQLGSADGSGTTIQRELELPCPDQTFQLPTAVQAFRGRVVDESQRPLEDVDVELVRDDERGASASTTSARDGTFELAGLPPGAACRLVLWHQAYLPATFPVWTTAAEEPPTFELRRAGVVRVRLTDPSGAPVKGRSISILSPLPDEPLRPAEAAWLEQNRYGSRTTDDAGRVQFGQLAAGRVELGLSLPVASRNLDALGNARSSEVIQRWVLPVQEREQPLVVDLSSYPALVPRRVVHRGVVLDAGSGAPLSGAWVSFNTRAGSRQTMTTEDGRFSIQGVPSPSSITVMRLGYLEQQSPEQPWDPGTHEHRFELRPGGCDLTLEFVDADGVRLPKLHVSVMNEAGKCIPVWQHRNDMTFFASGPLIECDGLLELRSLAEGRLDLRLSIGGHVLGSASVEVVRGPPREESIRLERSLAEMRREIERARSGE